MKDNFFYLFIYEKNYIYLKNIENIKFFIELLILFIFLKYKN